MDKQPSIRDMRNRTASIKRQTRKIKQRIALKKKQNVAVEELTKAREEAFACGALFSPRPNLD